MIELELSGEKGVLLECKRRLIFTTSGPQATIVLTRMAEKISERQSLPRSVVASWLRCRLSFDCLSLIFRPFFSKQWSPEDQLHQRLWRREIPMLDADDSFTVILSSLAFSGDP